jgi:hypothetical protein
MVLHALESDAANMSLSSHSAKENAVLVLVWCYKARGDREQDLWKYCLPGGGIKQWYGKSMGGGSLCK